MLTVLTFVQVTLIGGVPITEVTGALPDAAKVTRPNASTEIEGLLYEPGVTVVGARLIVPEDVIGPPVRPLPVLTEVTVPLPPPPPPVALIVPVV